ncbi:hypothetical protein LNQ52_07415 [Klebsiella pneumoniae subsp. pneumoniae]|nr:hypothetical protein [Klebsiella pneumoniae subsp. pneumoniae]
MKSPAYQRKQQPVQNYSGSNSGRQATASGLVRLSVSSATYAKWDENWGYSNTSGLQDERKAAEAALSPPAAVTTAKLPSVPRWKCGGNTVRRTVTWRGVSPS